MTLLLAALAIFVAGGLAALAAVRRPAVAAALGAGSIVAGSALGLLPAAAALVRGDVLTLCRPWAVPHGSFALRLDALSAFFLVAIFVLAALSAVYGLGYLHRRMPGSWFPLNLLVASMALVVLADNAVLFLVAWEGMAVSSFFLVGADHQDPRARRAGYQYLVASHLGTAFVLALFVVLGRAAGSFDFARFPGAGAPAGALLLLALAGFGTKAGLVPLHVWLPEAHPAAPSHVSALMSGVMIKTGIYGLLRVLTWLGPLPRTHGWLLVAIGVFTAVVGVLLALAQRDLKRLLAYCSVENVGIIVLGIGLGELGLSAHRPELAVLGFGGALLHVWNHALFKGLLFFGAGAVLHATGTTAIDAQGGLARRMRWTSTTFLVGAAAISGLPPLNGFVSEFLIFLSAVGGLGASAAGSLGFASAILGLGLAGGLAAACFAKASGIAFLGEPRTPAAAAAHEVGPAMRAPMVALAALCGLVGLNGIVALHVLLAPVKVVCERSFEGLLQGFADAADVLLGVTFVGLALVAATGVLVLVRRRLLARRSVRSGPTWDCGYAQPTARMQYTGASFSRPLTDMAVPALPLRVEGSPPEGLFPRPTRIETRTPDPFAAFLFAPLFAVACAASRALRRLQAGRTHLYVLYIVAALIALLLLVGA